eukprot:2525751-Pyramimonas_sp.AAC.1
MARDGADADRAAYDDGVLASVMEIFEGVGNAARPKRESGFMALIDTDRAPPLRARKNVRMISARGARGPFGRLPWEYWNKRVAFGKNRQSSSASFVLLYGVGAL